MITKVVNKSTARPSGRDVYIGRPSQYQNPYVIGEDGDRANVLEKYKRYFCRRMATEPEFRQAIESLRGKRLVCWCKPLPCHGDVIAAWLEDHT